MANIFPRSKVNYLYELNNHFIFSDYLHDKNSFTPQFLKIFHSPETDVYSFFRTFARSLNQALNQKLYNTGSSFKYLKSFPELGHFLKDETRNIIYVGGYSSSFGSTAYLYRKLSIFDFNNDSFSKVSDQDHTSSGVFAGISMTFPLLIKDGILYYMSILSKGSNGSVSKYNPEDGSNSNRLIKGWEWSSILPIKINQDLGYIYIFTNSSNGTSSITVKYLRCSDFSLQNLYTFNSYTNNSAAFFGTPSERVDIDSVNSYFYQVCSDNETNLTIKRFLLQDRDTPSMTHSDCNIDWSGENPDVEFPRIANNYYDIYITNAGGKTYLSVVEEGVYYSCTNPKYLRLFEISSTNPDNLTYKGKIELTEGLDSSQTNINGIIPLNNNKNVFIIFFQDGFSRTIRFNETLEMFEIVDEKSAHWENFGMDEIGRIWAVSNNFISIEGINIPYTIDIRTSNDTYEWTGSDINTSLIVNAYNYLGNRSVATVELTLEGNVKFTDNSKVKQITTSDTSDTIVDIVITGPGIVEVIPKIIL